MARRANELKKLVEQRTGDEYLIAVMPSGAHAEHAWMVAVDQRATPRYVVLDKATDIVVIDDYESVAVHGNRVSGR